MVQTEEGWHTLPDGVKLYTKTWTPDVGDSVPNARLVFIHGFSDHCNAYYNFFPTLASPPHNIQVHSFDQRGWGRSVHKDSDKGLTGPTTTVLSDIRSVMLSLPPSPIPLFLMGHSMGGGEVYHFLLTTHPTTYITPPLPKIHGLLLESPYVALDPSSQPSTFTIYAGKLAGFLLPHQQHKQKLDATYMSRDPQVREDWVKDPLCHDTGTLEGLSSMLQRASDLVSLSEGTPVHGLQTKLPCPVLHVHGSGDRVTSYPASKKLFEVIEAPGGDKTFHTVEGGYHKLHVEPDGVGEKFVHDVGEWIVKHAKTAGTSQGDEEGKAKL